MRTPNSYCSSERTNYELIRSQSDPGPIRSKQNTLSTTSNPDLNQVSLTPDIHATGNLRQNHAHQNPKSNLHDDQIPAYRTESRFQQNQQFVGQDSCSIRNATGGQTEQDLGHDNHGFPKDEALLHDYHLSRYREVNTKWIARYSKQAFESYTFWNELYEPENKEIDENCAEIGTLTVVYPSPVFLLHLLTTQ